MSDAIDKLTQAERDALDAATFRRLLKHLDENRDVQNIDLMILANFLPKLPLKMVARRR